MRYVDLNGFKLGVHLRSLNMWSGEPQPQQTFFSRTLGFMRRSYRSWGAHHVRNCMGCVNVHAGCVERAIANDRDNPCIEGIVRVAIGSWKSGSCVDRGRTGRSSFLTHVRKNVLLSTADSPLAQLWAAWRCTWQMWSGRWVAGQKFVHEPPVLGNASCELYLQNRRTIGVLVRWCD